MRARLALAGLLYAACASGDQTVTVGPGLSFSPPSVSVAPGEKVTWIWAAGPHSSTSDATTGPDVWDSGVLLTGSFDHVFTTPGTHPYYCSVHSFPGGTAMNGVVEVRAPATSTPTSTAVATLTATATPTSLPTTLTTTPGPFAAPAIPTVGAAGRFVLALGLVAAALSLLLFSRAR
jgi:plastocyanin